MKTVYNGQTGVVKWQTWRKRDIPWRYVFLFFKKKRRLCWWFRVEMQMKRFISLWSLRIGAAASKMRANLCDRRRRLGRRRCARLVVCWDPSGATSTTVTLEELKPPPNGTANWPPSRRRRWRVSAAGRCRWPWPLGSSLSCRWNKKAHWLNSLADMPPPCFPASVTSSVLDRNWHLHTECQTNATHFN